jgi:hypothetical protein
MAARRGGLAAAFCKAAKKQASENLPCIGNEGYNKRF